MDVCTSVETRSQCWVSFSLTLCLILETESLTASGVHLYGKVVRPLSSKDPPASVSSAMGLNKLLHHFYPMGVSNLDSGLHSLVASNLPTELFPQLQIQVFFFLFVCLLETGFPYVVLVVLELSM